MQCDAMQYNTIKYNSLRYNTTRFNATGLMNFIFDESISHVHVIPYCIGWRAWWRSSRPVPVNQLKVDNVLEAFIQRLIMILYFFYTFPP